MRVVMIVLAIVQLLIAGYGAAIGGFADGGEWWERLVIMVAQPAAAVAWSSWFSSPARRRP